MRENWSHEMPGRAFNNPNLFVISGGPGSGKTTVLRELAKFGFQHAPEVARQIIREQIQAGGTALPWGDRGAYTELMLQRSIESFRDHPCPETDVHRPRNTRHSMLRAPHRSV